MSQPERESIDYYLLKALRRGDERFVREFFSDVPETSVIGGDAVEVELPDAKNVTDPARRRSWRGVTAGGNSTLHIVAGFRHLELAKFICARDSSLLRECNRASETPLHCAARAGADGIVKLFISVATDSSRLEELLLAKDREGKTALYVAAEEGHAAAAKELMLALPKLATEDDEKGVSPLYVAVQSESLKVVQILIESPDTSYGGPNGQTALHAATKSNNPEIAIKLLRWKAALAKKADNSGSTPLHYLAKTVNCYIVRQLLKYDTSPAYHSDSKGFCPVHVASSLGRSDIVCELINCCPDMDELVDNKGRNFLQIAVVYNQAMIVRFVCQRPLLGKMMNAKDYDGNTPLHLAVAFQNHGIMNILLENKSVQLRITNKDGQTPQDLAKTRLDKSVHAGIMNKDGQTPPDYEIVHPSIINKDGRTPLDNEIIGFEHGSRTPLNDEITRLQHGSTVRFDHESDDKIPWLEFCSILQHAHERDSGMGQIKEPDYNRNASSLTGESGKDDQTMFDWKSEQMGHVKESGMGQIKEPEYNRSASSLSGESGKDDQTMFGWKSKQMGLLATEMAVLRQPVYTPGAGSLIKEKEKDDHIKFSPETKHFSDSTVQITDQEEEEEEEDQTVFGWEWKRMGDKLLEAVMRRDENFVRRLFPPATEASVIADHSAIDVHGIDNVAHQAGRRSYARDSSLLAARNAALETPLHCAARTGADRIVSLFISEARRWEESRRWEEVLRAKDREGKTALHAAAEEGHAAVVRLLVSEDPGLAAMVDGNGVSPLYAAVLSKSLKVVQILIKSPAEGGKQAGTTSAGATPKTSYAGPNRQTALHAAALVESPEIVDKLLQWKAKLTKKVDKSRSTPLHYLAATANTTMVCQLLKYDASLAKLSDSKGFYPVHIAARMGRWAIIRKLIDQCPGMDELVDEEEGNFLHIAVQNSKPMVVKYVCQQRKLVKMMNAKNREGNTPLHLAVSYSNQEIVRLLVENGSVQLSVQNKGGQTPLDVAITQIDSGLISIQNPQIRNFYCLQQIGATCGLQRLDCLIYENNTKANLENELKKYESTVQNLVIVSVLIATVTFAAAFTMPGGYKADDHQNGGTPTLARKYAFKAFIVSDFVAFLCSIMVTIWLMYAGSLVIHPSRRVKLILWSERFVYIAAQSMMAAFALSVYLVLAPVNISIGIAVCIVAFPSVLLSNPENWPRFRLAMTLKRRLGWSGICKACFIARPDLGLATESFSRLIFWPIVCYLLVYIFIFGLSLILSIKHLDFT